MDITPLYTVIPNDEGLMTLEYTFSTGALSKNPQPSALLRLAELDLTLNCFSLTEGPFSK